MICMFAFCILNEVGIKQQALAMARILGSKAVADPHGAMGSS